ncbi:hypothetical protein GH714_028250 [Hevea brasiliensis]|uniref:X8 domain-containing protein n=1 Tax=Hevea brasiliensis TaxID=3981 RepID=A0A6A6MLM2_HEVBR|nr:hypothetical protein GH714_028250 [Hevea brasiliensis]
MARYDITGIGINHREVPDESGGVKLKVLGFLDGPAHTAGVRQVKHGNCGPIQSIEVQRQLIAQTPVFYRLGQVDKRHHFWAGIEISKLFLNEGNTVIYTVGRDPRYQNTIIAQSLITAPIIVASALRENCRPVIVGKELLASSDIECTIFQGLIQSVFELPDGSGVVVTIENYVTPNQMDINGNGIEPDYQNFPGGSWCIASPTASETALQVALDYACGYGGAECSAIQPGASCYNPNTVRDHASYAFNDYYQKNPIPTSCVFGGTAQLTNTDPSNGNCHYASSNSTRSLSPPTPTTPTTTSTTPTTMTPPITTTPSGPTIFGVAEPTGLPSSATSVSISLLLFCSTAAIVDHFLLQIISKHTTFKFIALLNEIAVSLVATILELLNRQ